MKKILIVIVITITFLSCSKSNTDKVQSSVNTYLKEKLKNYSSYKSISFSPLDSIKDVNNQKSKDSLFYGITHFYTITNSDNEDIKMTVSFFLDKNFKVLKTYPESINGGYGSMTGNVFWKYNEFVGNRADTGAEVVLYSTDTIRKGLKYTAKVDLQGKYKFDKVLSGNYFLVVRSENTTECPEDHIEMLGLYANELKVVFGFDLIKYKKQLDEINKLHNLYLDILIDEDSDKYGGISNQIAKYSKLDNQVRDKSAKLIESFPEDFKSKIKMYSSYGNSYDFSSIAIIENKNIDEISDFGLTCL
ncbi:MAG TPA: hypothetical protein DCM02_13040 [Flavobacterium sp.]|nr:hypothetical protein [Flavobacterium sp.]HAT76650.1 hypothetical protein [Flavobacterium sp.]